MEKEELKFINPTTSKKETALQIKGVFVWTEFYLMM